MAIFNSYVSLPEGIHYSIFDGGFAPHSPHENCHFKGGK